MRRALLLLLAPAVAALAACAQIQMPGGGPVDRTPPRVVSEAPDSGAVGLGEVRELRVSFSEKTNKSPARSWLTTYPRVPLAGTSWDGRRTARIRLEEPLPPDTVIVVEVGTGLADMHDVRRERLRSWPLATAPALPPGVLSGTLVHADQPAVGAVVELLPAEAESGAREALRQPLRRTVADSSGAYRLPWLPVPGGPWRVRAFVDRNDDLRLDEREPVRLVASAARLVPEAPQVDLGLKIVYDRNTPGELVGTAPDSVRWPGPLLAWAEPLPAAEKAASAPGPDTPRRPPAKALQGAVPGRPLTLAEVPPGLARLTFFVDADRDSALSVLPAPGRAGGWLEPHAVVDSLAVEPGLPTTFAAPAFPDTLVWIGAAPDSAAAGAEPAAGEKPQAEEER